MTVYGAVVPIMVDVVPAGVSLLQDCVNLLGVAVRILGACTTRNSASSSSISESLLLPLILVASCVAITAVGLLGPLLLGGVDLCWWRWSLKWRLWHEIICLRWRFSHP